MAQVSRYGVLLFPAAPEGARVYTFYKTFTRREPVFGGLVRRLDISEKLKGEFNRMGPLQITPQHEHRYHDQHLDLDFEKKTASLDSKPVAFTRKEFDLLALLIQNAGEVVTRETLLMRVWGYGHQIRTRTLDVHIRRLRKKLGEHSNAYIETIFSVGYRFQPFRARLAPRLVPVMALGA